MALSDSRPTLETSTTEPGFSYAETFLRVLNAVKRRRGLIHGELEDGGGYCAVGSYFAKNDHALDTEAVRQIVAVNDRFPKLTNAARWKKVKAWLERKVEGF